MSRRFTAASIRPAITRASRRPGPRAALSYLGTYAADRQDKLDALLLEPARRRPGWRFLIGGAQYPQDFAWTDNIFFWRHVAPAEHPRFYAAARATLNVTRRSMAESGWCPSGRLFEAAACATPILSDWWEGLDAFFAPGSEILVVRSTEDVLAALDRERPRTAAHRRGGPRPRPIRAYRRAPRRRAGRAALEPRSRGP